MTALRLRSYFLEGIMKNKKSLRLAGLVRVSHEEQVKHGYSLEAQKAALESWAAENGHVIVGWYIDEGVTARKKVKNRPQLQRLLSDLQRGGIDMIVFTKLDRYFRSVAEYHETQKILELHGVHWKAILEDFDTTTTDGRFKINMMLSIAEAEADRTSDRIIFTFEHKVKKKQPISGSQPFGYKIGRAEDGSKCIIIDEAAAPVVRAVLEHFAQYNSISGATFYAVHELGASVSYNVVQKIIKNPYYHGHYRGVDDYCPAYISKADFERNQSVLQNRHIKTPRSRRVYLFSGLLVCPHCGRKLAASSAKNAGCNRVMYYRCLTHLKDKSCPFNRSLAERKLEGWLLEKIKPELERFVAEVEVGEPAAPVGDRSEIAAEMERLNYMFEKNRIALADYDKKYTALEKKLEALDAAPAAVDLSRVREFLNSDILDIYAGLSREDKRAAWRQIIDHIVADKNGEHVVHFLRQ